MVVELLYPLFLFLITIILYKLKIKSVMIYAIFYIGIAIISFLILKFNIFYVFFTILISIFLFILDMSKIK